MLQLKNITVKTKDKILINDINLKIPQRKVIGITGKSGSGKTTILKAIMGILNKSCKITDGEILIDNTRIDRLSFSKRRNLGGTTIGFIPQNPMTSFDSRINIGKQLIETYCLRLGVSKYEANNIINKGFNSLNLSDVDRIINCYPSELSGGMLQRIAVSILLQLKPMYILADEPTSALDEENTKILISELKKQQETAGILVVSHDCLVLKSMCSYIYVLEEGAVIEEKETTKLFESPEKTWTSLFVKANKKIEEGDWVWEKYG